MAFSWQEEVVPSGTTDISVDIEYLDKSYVYLYLDQVLTSAYQWISDSVIRLDNPVLDSTTVTLVRRTAKEYLYLKFAEGAAFIRENLDTQNTQFLHLAQEMVEGRSIEGFYGDLSMNGYRITNLGVPVNPDDAVPKWVTDELDLRTSALETSFIADNRIIEWFHIPQTGTDTIEPPFQFTAARVFVGGLAQPHEYAYVVVDNTILLAEPVLPGTVVHCFLGSPEVLPSEYVTASEFVSQIQSINDELLSLNGDVQAINTALAGKAGAGANFDITALNSLTTPITLAQGGTGASNATGARAAISAAKSGDNGDITALSGLTTALSVAQGGTGATTGAAARLNLGLSSLSLGGTVPTGTPNTGAFAADTSLAFGAAYSQSEHTTAANWIKSIAQRVLFLEQALRNNSIQKV